MGVTISKAGPGDRAAVREWIGTLFGLPEVACHFPAEYGGIEWQEELADRICGGEAAGFIPTVDGKAAGLFWIVPWDGGLWGCHWAMAPQYRGWATIEAARMTAEFMFSNVPAGDLDWMMGMTPGSNGPSVAAALAVGFTECGRLPGYFGDDEAVILCLRRP